MSELSPEEIEKINEENLKKTEEDFTRFSSALRKGQCDICGNPLSSFDAFKPCMHWLLKPREFKKRHFPRIIENFGYDRLEAYLRWVANTEIPFRNINDMPRDNRGQKLIETTIRQGKTEWSFSISQGCLEGKDGGHGPHYHFQMRINEKPFIDYGDYHIPLTDYDLWCISVRLGKNPHVKPFEIYGMGMRGATKLDADTILDNMRATDNYDEATFHTSTVLTAKDGKKISGADIARLVEKKKATGIPLAKLTEELEGVDRQVIISPGEGVPNLAYRKGARTKS